MKTRAVLAATVGAAVLALAGPATAQAAIPGGHPAAARAASASTASAATSFVLNAGQSADIPTWFWGPTTVCAFNGSFTPTTMKLASRTGAAPEYIPVDGFGFNCVSRWWWGIPVQVVNLGPGGPLHVSAS